jgi:uncharacterized repeat protein (TIGR03803 family)
MTRLSASKAAGAVLVFFVATTIAAQGQTFTTLADLPGIPGYEMSLVQGPDGELYGTTYNGGVSGEGTFFKMTQTGTLTVLYSFDYMASYPESGVALGTDGNFYGTTAEGGGGNGNGSVFRITPEGALTILHGFSITDGSLPYGPPVEGTDGNFYGTTRLGGNTTECFPQGCGTVYKMTRSGVLTTLHSFDGADGAEPWAGLVQATNGDFYGTTYEVSTLFKITRTGTLTTVHSFNGTDGVGPIGTLIQGTDGYLYGTTQSGGTNGDGTAFKSSLGGKLTTLYDFCEGQCLSGIGPVAGLVQGTDGNFYGTTSDTNGTVFQLTQGDIFTVLYDFGPGENPVSGAMVQATTGKFFGATSGNVGTAYSLDMSLGPFVTFVRAAGKIGQTGGILGQGFTGTSAVSLNGTPANFKVVSDTYLTATVPAGATTGYVTVTTPSGTLTSNVPFHVLK